MINLSENAVHKIKEIIKLEGKEGQGLRLGVKAGGCSGFSYIMKFDNNYSENDQVLNIDDVKILIDSKSLVYLAGTTIDFTDGLNGSGFVFQNPNATRSCGCGSSFSA